MLYVGRSRKFKEQLTGGWAVGKRSNFERKPRDFYPTPYEAVIPLLPWLPPHSRFDEPCAGDGDLIAHLERNGHTCAAASDIEGTEYAHDARTVEKCQGDFFITNPPWSRDMLHPIIENLRVQAPTWLLFDADWMHTKQAAPYLEYCHMIVSVGRVKWIPDSKMTGKDNCAWYLFDNTISPTEFVGRI
jgi:hypothetical protein